MESSILILAAGSSSRMGESKQLLKVGNEPLLIHTVNVSLQSHCSNVTVVLGSNFRDHLALINHLPVSIVENKEWEKGMGSSIRIGVKSILNKNPRVEAIIILVCDQPYLNADHLNKMLAISESKKYSIIASQYANTLGVPALFKRELITTLTKVADDAGAKKMIQENLETTKTIEFPKGSIDLDTPADYANYLKIEGQGLG